MRGVAMIYLATPYTHEDPAVMQRRFEVANSTAAKLMQGGFHVFSPISHTHPIALAGDLPHGWDYWKEYDERMLRACQQIMVLMQEGWERSVGVQAEIKIARQLGLQEIYTRPL